MNRNVISVNKTEGRAGRAVAIAIALAFPFAFRSSAQSPAPKGVPVKVLITLGHSYGQQAPLLTEKDLTVTQQHESLPVTNLTPLQGTRAGLEMFLLVDNCSSCDPNSKFTEIRDFVRSQAPTTAVGIAYIENGHLAILQPPTFDHERAIKSLSAPTGNQIKSPYAALTELIKKWPPSTARRAVLMITTGIDPAAATGQEDPAVEEAIEAAQEQNVGVYAIYHPNAGYLEGDLTPLYSGQVQLAHLANETGGEAYFLGFTPLPSLAPFLSDIATHLANQYEMEFLAPSAQGPGALKAVKVESNVPGVQVVAPYRVWVPGAATPAHKERP